MADDTISREAESVERKALAALHAAAGPALRDRLGLGLTEIGDGVASVAAALPPAAITINRAFGFGRARAVTRDEIDRIKSLYAEAGVARYFVQPDPSTRATDLAPLFEAAGLAPARGWQKFVRGRDEPVPAVETEFVIREAGPEDGPHLAAIVCDAFDLGEAALPWIVRMPAAPGWRVFLAMAGRTTAGVGALYLAGAAAYADFGATARDFRGRGAQLATLAARVRAALEAGAERIHTCTGVAVPGEAQHAYGNIKRCGFAETHVRATWAPPKT